ncbi:MAG: hypothetical protein ACR2HJ_08325 [Fimbriimonadales bacterium]
MSRLGAGSTIGTVIAFLAFGPAIALIPPDISQRDYLGNIRATNRIYFIWLWAAEARFLCWRRTWLPRKISARSYMFEGRTFLFDIGFENRNDVALNVTFSFTEPKFERTNYPDPDINLGGNHTENFVLPAGQYRDVNVTVTGLPT